MREGDLPCSSSSEEGQASCVFAASLRAGSPVLAPPSSSENCTALLASVPWLFGFLVQAPSSTWSTPPRPQHPSGGRGEGPRIVASPPPLGSPAATVAFVPSPCFAGPGSRQRMVSRPHPALAPCCPATASHGCRPRSGNEAVRDGDEVPRGQCCNDLSLECECSCAACTLCRRWRRVSRSWDLESHKPRGCGFHGSMRTHRRKQRPPSLPGLEVLLPQTCTTIVVTIVARS